MSECKVIPITVYMQYTVQFVHRQDFIDKYLEAAGPEVLKSVGAYQMEGLGLNLFDHIRGDYFTVLGLPMFTLMKALRQYGVVAS